MAKHKPLGKKIRLNAKHKQTRWAPYWTVLRIFARGRRAHPSRFTRIKRSWKRSKLQV